MWISCCRLEASTPCADCFPTHQLWPGVELRLALQGNLALVMSAGEKNLHFKFEVHQTHNKICKMWVKLMSEQTSCSEENWQWVGVISMMVESGRPSWRWTCQTGVAGTLLNHLVQTCINLACYLYPRARNSIHNYGLKLLYLMCYCFRLRWWNMPYKKHPLMLSLVPRPHPLSGFGMTLP